MQHLGMDSDPAAARETSAREREKRPQLLSTRRGGSFLGLDRISRDDTRDRVTHRVTSPVDIRRRSLRKTCRAAFLNTPPPARVRKKTRR